MVETKAGNRELEVPLEETQAGIPVEAVVVPEME